MKIRLSPKETSRADENGCTVAVRKQADGSYHVMLVNVADSNVVRGYSVDSRAGVNGAIEQLMNDYDSGMARGFGSRMSSASRARHAPHMKRTNPKVTVRKNAVDDDDDEYLRRQLQKHTEQAAPRLFAAAAAAASDPSFPAWRLEDALFRDTDLFPTHGPGPRGSNYFFDSHGGLWRVAPPDAPGAQAFGPVGSSVPIPLSLYRSVREKGYLETDEAGWEWISPTFFW